MFHEELQEVELAERENKRRREEEEARDRQEQLYKVGRSTDRSSDRLIPSCLIAGSLCRWATGQCAL